VLSQTLQDWSGDAASTLVQEDEEHKSSSSVTKSLAIKLDSLSKLLDLQPYTREGTFSRRHPIDENDIAPVHIICPISMECETAACQSHAILKYT